MAIEKCQGVANIERLQTHPNTQIYLKALKILEDYFPLESEFPVDAQLQAESESESGSISIFDF